MSYLDTYTIASEACTTASLYGDTSLTIACSDVAMESLKAFSPATEDAAYACAVFAAQTSLGMEAT